MPYTIESLINNSPIPPLPRFNASKIINSQKNENVFEISENDINIYKDIFYNNKDTNKEYMTQIKAIIFFHKQNYGDKIEKILELIKPLQQPSFLNLKEFIIVSHLLNLTKSCEVPTKLPQNLATFLGRNPNISKPDLNKVNINYEKRSDVINNDNISYSFQNQNVPAEINFVKANSMKIKGEQIDEKIIIENKIKENLKKIKN